MHPDDAAVRGIVDGMRVRLMNDRGICFLNARISKETAPGVVRARSVRWNQYTHGQLGVNQLTSERLTDIGGGPTFYSCLVEVTAVPA
jgi:anaerobic selenocysteine-containing dehydrogenase